MARPPRGSLSLSLSLSLRSVAITFYERANIVAVTQSGRASQLSDRQFRHTEAACSGTGAVTKKNKRARSTPRAYIDRGDRYTPSWRSRSRRSP